MKIETKYSIGEKVFGFSESGKPFVTYICGVYVDGYPFEGKNIFYRVILEGEKKSGLFDVLEEQDIAPYSERLASLMGLKEPIHLNKVMSNETTVCTPNVYKED